MSRSVLSVILLGLVLTRTGAIADDSRPMRTLSGHERWVLSVAVSPDSKRLASGSDDQTLKIWDLESGVSKTLRTFDSAVTALAFSKDGKRLAVGTWDGELMLCDPQTGKVLLELSEHKELITTVVFDANGDFLASGSADDTLIVWDASNGEELLTMHQGNEYDVTTAAFSPDSKRIVTGDGENELKIWDTETGEETETLTGHTAVITSADYSPNGNQIVSASWDKTLRLWNTETGDEIRTLRGHTGDVNAVLFIPTGSQIVSASEDKTVRIWDTATGNLLSTFTGHHDSVCCIAISSNGEFVVSGSKKEIKVWKLKARGRTSAGGARAGEPREADGQDDDAILLKNALGVGIGLAGKKDNPVPRTGFASSYSLATVADRRKTYTTVEEARKAGPDFDFQGEYVGNVGGDAKRRIGVQVIALGRSRFQVVFLPGGLPGAGWDGEHKILCDGSLASDGHVELTPPAPRSARGRPRKYLRGPPDEFLATREFPPPGHEEYRGTIEGKKISVRSASGETITAEKQSRKSPTLGAAPPDGAIVLLSFQEGKLTSLEGWEFRKKTPWTTRPDGSISMTDRGGNRASIRKDFGSRAWTMHLEFRTAYSPSKRGQGRSNSGVFPAGLPEIQVLDTFGLEGTKHECGSFYGKAAPRVNMCLPPLAWQTYDVIHTPARRDDSGKVIERPRCTIKHNGVVIHKGFEIKGGQGHLSLQHHGETGLAYRNIWVLAAVKEHHSDA